MENKKFIRKKGQISILIFVISILAVCILAVFSFIISEKGNNPGSIELVLTSQMKSLIEKYYFYKNIGEDPSKYLDIKSDEAGRYLFLESKKIKIKHYLFD